MAQPNSSSSKTTTLGSGMLQVLRTTITSTAAITVVLVLAGIAFGITGCSPSKSRNTSITSNQRTQVPAISVPTLPKPKKTAVARRTKPAGKRPETLTYVSSTYGVSFRFPGQFDLTTPGNDGESSLVEEVPGNFVQPGGVTVATIELPSGSATSFFSISANRNLTAQECREFAVPAPSDFAANSPVDASDTSLPSTTSIHGVEFTKVENASEQEDVKYYHHFEPATAGNRGTCYEFALGVEQARVSSKVLDYPELFDKLERVMSTVEFKEREGIQRASSNAAFGH